MQIFEVTKLYVLHLKQLNSYGELSVCFVYFSFLIYLCMSDRSFNMLKIRYLERVIHGAVILFAEILGDLCYYELKPLQCILNRINRTYNLNAMI